MTKKLTRIERSVLIALLGIFVIVGGGWTVRRVMHPPDTAGKWRTLTDSISVQLVTSEDLEGHLAGAAVLAGASADRPNALLRLDGAHVGQDVTISLYTGSSIAHVLMLRFQGRNRLTGEIHGLNGRPRPIVLERL